MELIKLLDVANPKVIKDTLNRVSQDYETFRTEIEEAANAALNTAVTANDTANTALTTVTDYEAIVMESAQDSSSARLVAEEALAMITQADERSQEAALLAEQSFTEASEAVQTSELAMNVANEAKSTVDQALDIGSLGSFVHNVNGIALAHAHMTDDPNQADDEELSFLATPTLVREAIKGKADLTNTEQTIIAGRLEINDGALDFSNEGAGIYIHGERPRLIFKADGIEGKANSGFIQGMERGLSVTSPGTLSMYANEDIKLIPDGYIILDTDTHVNGPLQVSGNINFAGLDDTAKEVLLDFLLNPTPIYPQVNDSKFEADIECIQLGKIVLVKVADLRVTSSFTHGDIIATGFPSPSVDKIVFALTGTKSNEGSSIRVRIRDGNLEIHYDEESGDTGYDKSYCGVFWYLTQ